MGPNPQEIADFVTLTEEILNGKLYFLRSVYFNTFLDYTVNNNNKKVRNE